MTVYQTCQSIALEIDVAISLALTPELADYLDERSRPDLSGLSEDWRSGARRFFERRPASFELVLGRLAMLTGTLTETDYERGKAVWSALEPADALARARAITRGASLDELSASASGRVGVDVLLEAFLEMDARIRTDAGFPGEPTTLLGERQRREYGALARLLVDDAKFSAFWSWVDELVYAHYVPWRETREDDIASEVARARAAIAESDAGEVALADWLPKPNPVASVEALRERVERGEIELVLWAEPFGFFDFLVLAPGTALTSFAAPDGMLRDVQEDAEQLAETLKALGNPTRLLALRLVRFMEMSNRDMANYLDVSEPTLSAHLKQLRNAGLVTSERHGRSLHHTLEAERLRRVLVQLEEFLAL